MPVMTSAPIRPGGRAVVAVRRCGVRPGAPRDGYTGRGGHGVGEQPGLAGAHRRRAGSGPSPARSPGRAPPAPTVEARSNTPASRALPGGGPVDPVAAVGVAVQADRRGTRPGAATPRG